MTTEKSQSAYMPAKSYNFTVSAVTFTEDQTKMKACLPFFTVNEVFKTSNTKESL